MLKPKRIILVCFALFLIFICPANGLSEEPVKIKGFFIGMTIDDALKNFERLGFEGLTIRENKYKDIGASFSIQPGSGDPFKVQTDINERTVSKIVFSSGIAMRLFNTKNIGVDIFKESFKEAYGILDMEPFKDNPGLDAINGWEHNNLKLGYRIRIYLNNDVEMLKTSMASEFEFD